MGMNWREGKDKKQQMRRANNNDRVFERNVKPSVTFLVKIKKTNKRAIQNLTLTEFDLL